MLPILNRIALLLFGFLLGTQFSTLVKTVKVASVPEIIITFVLALGFLIMSLGEDR